MDGDRSTTPSTSGKNGEQPAVNSAATDKGRVRREILIGTVAGLISGAIVSFFLTSTGHATIIAADHFWKAPNCSNPQWLLQVPDNSIFSSAYYFQQDSLVQFRLVHVPDFTVDGDLRTAWLQAWPSPSSSSNYIEWTFPSDYNVRLMCIVDGWTEDSETYDRTLPIGKATIYTTNTSKHVPAIGEPVQSRNCSPGHVSFKDYFKRYSYEWQGVTFNCDTNNVVLHIDGVSKASIKRRGSMLSKIQFYDSPRSLTGLSEVRFYYCPTMLCFLP
jgi:hypothetical protein